jgi:glycosyltransferase involved in cell wall biosynthesis
MITNMIGMSNNMSRKKKVWYLGLEPLKARYTGQLTEDWMPAAFNQFKSDVDFISVPGDYDPDQEIKVGAVLDAVGRGVFAMSQVTRLLDAIRFNDFQDGDIVYIQDMWHPGVEALFYAWDLYGYKDVKVYTRCWAQSVDEYDFTFPMREWMRYYELGFDKYLTGIFVASTIHRDQLREAGFTAPIHVLGLPVHSESVRNTAGDTNKQFKDNVVVYTSRFDKEKNPFFMMEVAKQFLEQNPNWEWHITTSGKEIRSMMPGTVEALRELSKAEPRFKIFEGISKQEYYTKLKTSGIQFNTALQDYVAFTAVEGDVFEADLVYPDFRSFKETVDASRRYVPFKVDSALEVLNNAIKTKRPNHGIAEACDIGILTEAMIVSNGIDYELNVWHEKELCKHLLTRKGINI